MSSKQISNNPILRNRWRSTMAKRSVWSKLAELMKLIFDKSYSIDSSYRFLLLDAYFGQIDRLCIFDKPWWTNESGEKWEKSQNYVLQRKFYFRWQVQSYISSEIFAQICVQYHVDRHSNEGVNNHEITPTCPRWRYVSITWIESKWVLNQWKSFKTVKFTQSWANDECKKHCMIESPLVWVNELILSIISNRLIAIWWNLFEYLFVTIRRSGWNQ